MKKAFWIVALTGLILADGFAQSTKLRAELVMPNGKARKGLIVGRDGEWVEFMARPNTRPLRLGISTIKEINFTVELDAEKLWEMKEAREYERVIASLDRTLEPFKTFSDVPSNLTKYNALLMELHYKVGNYEKSLQIAERIAADDRDAEKQEKGRIYQALAMIGAGQSEEATALLADYGWDQEINDDTAPEKLFITAKFMVLKEEYSKAMELVSKVIAFHSTDQDWIAPAELLCAQVYADLGMFESAEEVCRHIGVFYADSDVNDKAKEVKARIEVLRAEADIKKTTESE